MQHAPKEWKNKDGSFLKKIVGVFSWMLATHVISAYANIYIYTYYSNLPLQPLPYGHLHGVQGTKGVGASALGLMISHHLVQLLLRMMWCFMAPQKKQIETPNHGWICKLIIYIYIWYTSWYVHRYHTSYSRDVIHLYVHSSPKIAVYISVKDQTPWHLRIAEGRCLTTWRKSMVQGTS